MARLFWRFMLLTLKNVALSDRPKLNCSVTAATSQHFKVGNCAAKLLPRASKAAQRFCIPLQLELSCYLASTMLLNSCNLAVQMVTLKSNNHYISTLCNLVGRTYLMVTLKSNNHCISALCNLVGRTYLMVTPKSNNHCTSVLCTLFGRPYLMVTLKSNITTAFWLSVTSWVEHT